MSWFSEQLEERRKNDNESMQKAVENIAGAINNRSEMFRVSSDEQALSALSDIARSMGCTYDVDQALIEDKDLEINEKIDLFCKPNGIMRRIVYFSDGWYKDAMGVYMANHKETGEVVALLPDFLGYYYKDPVTKKRTHYTKKSRDLFEDRGLVFYRPLPMRPLKPIDLVKYSFVTKNVSDIVTLCIFMGLSTLIGMLAPVLTNFLYGTVLEQEPDQGIVLLISTCCFYLFYIIAQKFFGSFQSMVSSRISQKTSLYLEAGVMSRVLMLPPDFFREYSSGDLKERVEYVSQLADSLTSLIFGSSLSALFSLAYIGSMLAYAKTLVVPAIVIIILTVLVSTLNMLLSLKISKERMKAGVKQSAVEYDMLNGLQKIKLAGAEKRAFALWTRGYTKVLKYNYNPPTFLKINSVISSAISLGGTLAMYYFTIRSGISLSEYSAFNVAYGMVSGAFASLAGIALSVAQIKPILDMAKPILDAQPEVGGNKEVVKKVTGKIDISNVSFKYPGSSRNIIDNLSLSIHKGDYIAIVGKTGCGKSTLVRLLLGFEKPEKGSIFYDNKNIDTLDLRSLRRNIGTVMQDGKLFSGDIYSNIVVSAPWLTLDDAWKAAEIAGIADDIRNMPMEMNTLISEGAGGISGGQKQRILIARAVAASPKIMILDEATSALDNITQKKVCEALDGLDCTRIVIAHRLSTIKHCDRIIFLEDGKVVEDGTYDELISLNGKFAEMVERQRL